MVVPSTMVYDTDGFCASYAQRLLVTNQVSPGMAQLPYVGVRTNRKENRKKIKGKEDKRKQTLSLVLAKWP